MPAKHVSPDEVFALMNDAAELAVVALNAAPLAAGFAGEGTVPEEFVPGTEARAVETRLVGLRGRLVLLMSAGYAAAVQKGPLGNLGFTQACEPALLKAAKALEPAAPRAVRIEPAVEVPADTCLAGAESSYGFYAVPLFDGEAHEASLAVILEQPDAADASTSSEPSFEPDELPAYTAQTADIVTPAFGNGSTTNPFAAPAAVYPLRMLHDVEMDVTAELGRTRMTVRGILALSPGSVIELDRAAGSPVDLLVNGTLIGRGEVVVIDEEFGVRISEIIGRSDEATG